MSDAGSPPAAVPPHRRREVRDLEICNRKGLHARASARFVQCADRYNAAISVSKDGQSVSGGSIMGLMMLAASIGSVITVTAEGLDAPEAIAAISDLVNGRFGEDE